MTIAHRPFAIAALTALLCLVTVDAASANGRGPSPHGRTHPGAFHRHGHWGPGPFWGGVGIGIGVGVIGSRYYYADGYWYPRYVVAAPYGMDPVYAYGPPPAPAVAA